MPPFLHGESGVNRFFNYVEGIIGMTFLIHLLIVWPVGLFIYAPWGLPDISTGEFLVYCASVVFGFFIVRRTPEWEYRV